MASMIKSVKIEECFLFSDLTKSFERLAPVMARNVDDKLPSHQWIDVQIHDFWGMRNHDLSTDIGQIFNILYMYCKNGVHHFYLSLSKFLT